MVCIGLKLLLSSLQAGCGGIDPGGSVSRVRGALVMVCCVSSGSCDSSNVSVIYRPLDKQASLPQPVKVGLTNCSQSGVWGPSGAPKRLPEDPSTKWESFIWLLFHSGGDHRLSENERSEVWASPVIFTLNNNWQTKSSQLLKFYDTRIHGVYLKEKSTIKPMGCFKK